MNWYKIAKFNKNAKPVIPWTPDIETIKKIDYMYALPPIGEGFSFAEIGRQLQIPEHAIRNFFKKTGRHSRNKKEQLMSPYTKKKKEQAYMEKRKITSPEDIQVIIELYNEGNSIGDIADLYQVSFVLIKSILKRNNIARRNRQEAANTPISKEKSRKGTLDYWKNLSQQGIGFWDKLEAFLQKHIQNFPIEKQQEEYERKRKEILQAMGSGRKKNIALNIFKNNIKFS